MMLLREYAMAFVGRPYRWGGEEPGNGFDCSGLVQEILRSAGIDPPGDQSAQGLYDIFAADKTVQRDVFGLGALAFYGKSLKEITHVAFCVDSYRCVEAGGGGSKTLTPQDAAAQGAFVRMRPIKGRRDFLCVLKPRYTPLGMVAT